MPTPTRPSNQDPVRQARPAKNLLPDPATNSPSTSEEETPHASHQHHGHRAGQASDAAMTTYSDPRAARSLARGEAAKARAEAEALRAETARANTAAAAEQSRTDRAARREHRAAQLAAWRAQVPDAALAGLWAALVIAPLLLAWRAQYVFARDGLHFPAGMAWLFPLAIESGAWVCAFESQRRAKRGAPVGVLPRWMWLLAGFAGLINAAHGTVENGLLAGAALGALSLLGIVLHHIRQTLTRAEALSQPTHRAGRRLARWVLFPRLSLAAARITVRADCEPNRAWELASIDRYGVGPGASKRDRQLARLVTARQTASDRKAAKRGEFTVLNGVILRITLPDPTSVEPAPAAEAYTPVEREKLSATAAGLLPKVQAAITAGELSERPSAYAINKRFKGGMPAAQEVRGALADIHPVSIQESA